MDSQAPKKLLIVDQERFSALIAKMLSDSFITETAKDGIEAISYLRTNLPDLLLVEESIPGDGLRFCELMGMNPKFQDLPIILMSVSPSSKGILRARAAGVNSYLAKPFRPKDLQLRIGSIFATAETIQESETTKKADVQIPDENAGKTIRERLKQIEGLPSFPATHAQVFKSLGDYEGGSGFDRMGFWQHSVGTAFITRAISKKLQVEMESAFLAGMLHDLGKMVSDRCFSDYYRAVIEKCQKEQTWIGDSE